MSIFNGAIDLTEIPESDWKNYIGKGYRNCCYLYDEDHKGKIILFGYDLAGNPKTFICKHKSWIKYRVRYKTTEKDMYGNYVATKYFDNTSQRKKYLDNTTGLWIVEAFRPETEFLHKVFTDYIFDSDFNQYLLRTFFIDIETEISDTFAKPTDAENRINMITIYDTKDEVFHTWSLEFADKNIISEDSIKDIPKNKFDLRCFNGNETRLLEDFLRFWEQNYPDVVNSWNGKAYDYPYIVRRIENVLGKNEAMRLSPIKRYSIRDVNHANERADVAADIEVDISGIFLADELIFYRDKFGVKPNLDGGYSLDNVGESEKLGKKVEYEGSLKDLYLKNYQKFYEYNIQDVNLLKNIEDKCKLVPLARRVAGAGLVNYNAIYTSISYLIGNVAAFARKEMKGVILQSYINEKQSESTYEGAFVFPPVVGLYKGGIATIDVNSLYPSTIRALNLSPETFVGKVVQVDIPNNDEPIDLEETKCNTFNIIQPSGQSKKITKDELLKLCKEKCIFSRNNTLFLKHKIKHGIIAAWCKYFYNLRKKYKKEMQKRELQLYKHEIVGEENIQQTEIEAKNFNSMQLATKIMINSIYGILGTSHSPIANIHLAQSITRNGKFFNQSASKYVFEYFKKNYNADENYVTTISGDTDSNFLNIECLTTAFRKQYSLPEKINSWSDKDKLKLWKVVDDFIENDLNNYMQKLVAEKCFSEETSMLRYSLEYIGDCGIYEAKKHYCVHKIVSEGPELVDQIKSVGIELKKTVLPAAVKSFLIDIYENTLKNDWDENDFRHYINKCYDEFCKLSINDVGIWKGWNSDKIEAEGFLKTGKGTTGISKACRYYNDVIAEMGIAKKYNTLTIGHKYRFAYLNPNNIYRIDCIAFEDGQWPKEFDGVFNVDYDVMFQKEILQPLKRYLEATRFQNVDPRQRTLFDLNDL